MDVVASGTVTHLGTFNANPICAAAAVASVCELERRAGEIYPQLEEAGTELASILTEEAAEAGLPLQVNQVGAAAHAFVARDEIPSYAETVRADQDAYLVFAEALLNEGVYVIPRGLLYVSTMHGKAELARTRSAVAAAASATADALRARR